MSGCRDGVAMICGYVHWVKMMQKHMIIFFFKCCYTKPIWKAIHVKMQSHINARIEMKSLLNWLINLVLILLEEWLEGYVWQERNGRFLEMKFDVGRFSWIRLVRLLEWD